MPKTVLATNSIRTRALLGALTLLVTSTGWTQTFEDVAPDHWARPYVQEAHREGLVQGRGKNFEGRRPPTRYELAAVASRLLQKFREDGGASGLSPEDARNLQLLVAEVGENHLELLDQVEGLHLTVKDLQERLQQAEQAAPVGVSLAPTLSRGVAQAMTGFLSAGLVRTQEGANGRGGGFTRYHLDGSRTLDQTFFTLPQASLAIHHEVRPGTLLHMQFDYTTDAADPVGGGVGLNEAYMQRDILVGQVGGKIGGFALPFQDWEFDGPFRTLTSTITPSAIGTFLERFRVIGVEFTRLRDVVPSDTRWRLGIFTGADLPVNPTGDIIPPPTQDDSVGLGALSRSATFDGRLGYYLDLESGDSPDQNWGWRIGHFNLGGDLDAAGTNIQSQDFQGIHLGAWWRDPGHRLRIQSQYARAERRFVKTGFSPTDLTAGYVKASWKLAGDSSLSLRYDDLGFEQGTILPGSRADINSWLLAWNRKLSETDLFQIEYLTQDQPIPPRALLYPTGQPDPRDDLIQMRYKVWF